MLLSVYVIFVLIPDTIVPVVPKPTVESTVITVESLPTSPITLVEGVITKLPWMVSDSSEYPRNNDILKYCLFSVSATPTLVNASTSDMAAFVFISVFLNIVCPTNFKGSPEITSAMVTCLLT